MPSLESLAAPFVNENNTSRALTLYWYSQRMVEQLLRRNGNFVHFREFIQGLGKRDPDEVLQEFYGVTASQLLDEVK